VPTEASQHSDASDSSVSAELTISLAHHAQRALAKLTPSNPQEAKLIVWGGEAPQISAALFDFQLVQFTASLQEYVMCDILYNWR